MPTSGLQNVQHTVAAPNIEPHKLLHQHISLCRMMFLHGSLCLQLQLDVSRSFPPCIAPSITSNIVKTSSRHCTMVQYLAPLRCTAFSYSLWFTFTRSDSVLGQFYMKDVALCHAATPIVTVSLQTLLLPEPSLGLQQNIDLVLLEDV
jgi:hypothetical protein